MSLEDIENELKAIKTTAGVSVDKKNLAAAGDYAAEDVLSESATAGTPYQFKDVGKSGVIEKAIAFCSVTALTPKLTLYLFSQRPTGALNDNVANTNPTVADHPAYEGKIDFLAMEDLGGGSDSVVSMGTYGNLPLPYYSPDRVLYGVAVTRDAITGESVGMTLSITLQVRKV